MEQETPRVFISYSHDSPEHKQWVAELASRLRRDGIDAVLDQWEVSLGDDVTKFMEDGLSQSDRVLIICTESYVRKADAGKGGVGYERMIVTAELVKNLGTQKFIPVIKQGSDKTELPRFLGSRFYVNLSTEEKYAEQYEILLRELHKQPAVRKPPIGKNPFAVQPSGSELPERIETTKPLADLLASTSDASQVYGKALEIARVGDIVAWRKLINTVRQPLGKSLLKWREQIEREAELDATRLAQLAEIGIGKCAPLFAVALAGVESGRDKFKDQRAVIDELLNLKDWGRGGLVIAIELPKTLSFFFQGLHGAVCLYTDQIELALALVQMPIASEYNSKSESLFHTHDIMGWPDSLGGNCTEAWKFLSTAPDKIEWLSQIFGSGEEYKAALVGYYLALHVFELAETIAEGKEDILKGEEVRLDIPPCFLQEPYGIQNSGYRLLLRSHPQQIWGFLGVSRQKMAAFWPHWMRHASSWMSNVYRFRFHDHMVHENLLEDAGREDLQSRGSPVSHSS